MKIKLEDLDPAIAVRYEIIDDSIEVTWSGAYITWSTLELNLTHQLQNNPETMLDRNIEVTGSMEWEDEKIKLNFRCRDLYNYYATDDEGFYIELEEV